jgi:hypothetical protein
MLPTCRIVSAETPQNGVLMEIVVEDWAWDWNNFDHLLFLVPFFGCITPLFQVALEYEDDINPSKLHPYTGRHLSSCRMLLFRIPGRCRRLVAVGGWFGVCLAASVVEVRLNQGVLHGWVKYSLKGPRKGSEVVLVGGLACTHSTQNKGNTLFKSEGAGIFSFNKLPPQSSCFSLTLYWLATDWLFTHNWLSTFGLTTHYFLAQCSLFFLASDYFLTYNWLSILATFWLNVCTSWRLTVHYFLTVLTHGENGPHLRFHLLMAALVNFTLGHSGAGAHSSN